MTTTSSAPAHAIEVLSTQPSQLYTNLHPILLASILIFSFRSLVSDPVNTLLGIAPTVAILQATYCVVCLPSSNNPQPASNKPGPKKKGPKPAQDLASKLVVRVEGPSLRRVSTLNCFSPIAGLPLFRTHPNAHGANPLYPHHPLRCAPGLTPAPNDPAGPSPGPSHHSPTLLRSRVGDRDMDAPGQLATAC